MARLADVAHETGLSKSTVSRAFIHPEMVAENTRQRIIHAAKELDFRPNRAARALSTGKTGLIGLVVPTLSNPFFSPLVTGGQRVAEACSRHTLVVVSDYSVEREQALVSRLSSEVDGFIMVSPVGSDRSLRAVASKRPLVLVDRKVGPRLPAVLIDTPSGLAEVARGLLADGHRHIGYISGPQGSWSDAQRLAAVRGVTEGLGAALSVFGPLPPMVDAGIAVASEVISSGVTAVIGYNSSIVLGLLIRLGTSSRPGAATMVVACADSLIELRPDISMPVIMLDVPVEEAGCVAMNKLNALLNGEKPRRIDILPTKVIR